MSLTIETKKWMEAYCLPSLKGKRVLITGANSGIGFKETETVLALGADVIMACRSQERAEEARKKLVTEYPDASVTVMMLDLADLSSIDRFAQELEKVPGHIDLFVNNAGVFHQPGKTTADGFELVLGTNYFGSYYLSEKIVPWLAAQKERSIYVNTISIIHKIGTVDFEDFYFEKHYRNFPVYARSKICLARYTWNLAMKYRNSSVCVLMNHPGMAITPMGLNAFSRWAPSLAPLAKGVINSPEKSALSVPYMLSRSFEPGSIIGPNRLGGGWGYPEANHVYAKVKKGADELLIFTREELSKRNIQTES